MEASLVSVHQQMHVQGRGSMRMNMEYYSVIKEKVCHLQQRGWTWMGITVSEMSQAEK